MKFRYTDPQKLILDQLLSNYSTGRNYPLTYKGVNYQAITCDGYALWFIKDYNFYLDIHKFSPLASIPEMEHLNNLDLTDEFKNSNGKLLVALDRGCDGSVVYLDTKWMKYFHYDKCKYYQKSVRDPVLVMDGFDRPVAFICPVVLRN